MKCPNCHNILTSNNRYCTNCGQPITIKLSFLKAGKEPALFWEALDLYSRNDFSKAEKNLLELIIKHPQRGSYHNLLGAIYIKKANFNLAELHLRRTIELSPYLWEAYYNLAIISYEQKKYQEAKALFKKVIDLNTKHHQSLYNLGTILLKEGNYKEAIKLFSRVKVIAPNFSNNRINLDFALRKLKKSVER